MAKVFVCDWSVIGVTLWGRSVWDSLCSCVLVCPCTKGVRQHFWVILCLCVIMAFYMTAQKRRRVCIFVCLSMPVCVFVILCARDCRSLGGVCVCVWHGRRCLDSGAVTSLPTTGSQPREGAASARLGPQPGHRPCPPGWAGEA